MKAIIANGANSVELVEIPKPEKVLPNHLIVKMHSCAINSGDKVMLSGNMPASAVSQGATGTLVRKFKYNVCGASGVGSIVEAGEGVPEQYKTGTNIAIYRTLKVDEDTIGTWCEYAHLNYLQCAILPEDVSPADYSGSLVNIITPYSFIKQIQQEGHKGIVSTAGNSATGISLLGLCLAYKIPIISIVRNQDGKKNLEALGAENVLLENDPDFRADFQNLSQKLNTTAVFDGVGGALLSNIIDTLPYGSTVYCYGYLDKKNPVVFNSVVLMNGIILKGFSNVLTPTVRDAGKLQEALQDISEIIGMPHFRTKIGKVFSVDEVNEALSFSSSQGKAVLYMP